MNERDDQGRKRARYAPWLLLGPGMLFLLLFFSPVIIRSCASDTGTLDGNGESP